MGSSAGRVRGIHHLSLGACVGHHGSLCLASEAARRRPALRPCARPDHDPIPGRVCLVPSIYLLALGLCGFGSTRRDRHHRRDAGSPGSLAISIAFCRGGSPCPYRGPDPVDGHRGRREAGSGWLIHTERIAHAPK